MTTVEEPVAGAGDMVAERPVSRPCAGRAAVVASGEFGVGRSPPACEHGQTIERTLEDERCCHSVDHSGAFRA